MLSKCSATRASLSPPRRGDSATKILEAMHTAANQPMASLNVYGSTCPFCCGDLDDVAFLKTGAAACLFCSNKELALEQSRSRWPSLQVASAVTSRFGQGNALL